MAKGCEVKVQWGGVGQQQQAGTVHGDMRGSNVMMRFVADGSNNGVSGGKYEVQFVDFGWSGVDGLSRWVGGAPTLKVMSS